MKVSTTTPASATTTRETTMTEFPLLFTFRGLVAGNGFVAAVEACGRAPLVRESEEDWWFYGVEPGGIGEGGKTANEAHLAFNSSINGVLADVAEETPSFKDFKATAESFFGEIDRTDEARCAAVLPSRNPSSSNSDAKRARRRARSASPGSTLQRRARE